MKICCRLHGLCREQQEAHQLTSKLIISSYVGKNAEFDLWYLQGEPEGILSERICTGGAGVPTFFSSLVHKYAQDGTTAVH